MGKKHHSRGRATKGKGRRPKKVTLPYRCHGCGDVHFVEVQSMIIGTEHTLHCPTKRRMASMKRLYISNRNALRLTGTA